MLIVRHVINSRKHNYNSLTYRVEQRKREFFKWLVLGKGGVDDVGREPADSSDNAVSVAMAHWNVQRRVFAVDRFPQHLISRFGDVSWPPRSPDPSICNFFCGDTSSVECTPTDHARSKIWNFPFVKKSQLCRKKCWSMWCRTLRRGSECVSGKKDVIWLTLFSIRNLVCTLKMH